MQMAEKKDEKKVAPPAEETGVATVKTDRGLVSAAEVGAAMKKMKEIGDSIVADYFKFEVGEEKRMAPLAVRPFSKQNGDAGEAIQFIDEEGENYIVADAMLVTSLKPQVEAYLKDNKLRPFLVQCTGEKRSPKGTYKVFNVIPIG